MAFEYCAGTLDDMVNGKCEGPTDPLQQITSGLAFLHSSNIVHYNLKPSNILASLQLIDNGRIFITALNEPLFQKKISKLQIKISIYLISSY